MTDKGDDVQLLVSRVRIVSQRLETVAEKAAVADVKLLDGLNNRAVNKSVSTLEALCNDVESRLQRLCEMRGAA